MLRLGRTYVPEMRAGAVRVTSTVSDKPARWIR